MSCRHCDMIAAGKARVYEDDSVYAFHSPKPAAAGHIVLVPKKHVTILEELPDKLTGHMFTVANKLSTVLFEILGAHGTNIIVENGAGQHVPHVAMNIIARKENDGLGLEWAPLQMSEDDLKTAELLLKDNSKSVGIFEKEKPKPIEEKKAEEIQEENYLTRQLKRIP